jgi:hypothetical protein
MDPPSPTLDIDHDVPTIDTDELGLPDVIDNNVPTLDVPREIEGNQSASPHFGDT